MLDNFKVDYEKIESVGEKSWEKERRLQYL